jgi:hypothetical protein
MPHPFKQQAAEAAERKFQQITNRTGGHEGPYKKAERISGVQTREVPPPPEQAVPQFENDRSLRDPEYGSKIPAPTEGIS